MEFSYTAKKSINETVEGKIEADSLEHAVEKLTRQGVVPVSVVENNKARTINAPNPAFSPVGKTWGLKKVILFTRKLHNLTRAGVELLSALRMLEQNAPDLSERQVLRDIIKGLKEGVPLSECLARYPQCFSPLYVSIVRTGENTGQLKESFSQLLIYLQRLEDMKTKISQALAYPAFMVIVGGCAMFVMLTFVFPRLVGMFADFQTSLPWPTRALLAVSEFFRKSWIVLIAAAAAGYFIVARMSGGWQGVSAYLRYRLPVVKNLVYKQSVANFATSLSLLLKSGVPLMSAIQIATPVIANPEYIRQLELVKQDIKEGMPFSQALGKVSVFPDFFIQMIRVGETAGRLDSILADLSEAYQQEIESDLKIISSLIEPAIILAIGIVLGTMVIAVLLPIFNLSIMFNG